MVAMPIALRTDFDAPACRLATKRSKDGGQARRLLALATIYEGATRSEAARTGGVTVQIVRDWVVKLNTHGPAGLIDRKAPGRSARLTAEHRSALQKIDYVIEMLHLAPIPGLCGTSSAQAGSLPATQMAINLTGPTAIALDLLMKWPAWLPS